MIDNWEFPKDLQVGDKVEFELHGLTADTGIRWNHNRDYGGQGIYHTGEIISIDQKIVRGVNVYLVKYHWDTSYSTWHFTQIEGSREGYLRRDLKTRLLLQQQKIEELESTYLELL